MAKKRTIVESESESESESETTKTPLAARKPSASKVPQPPPTSDSVSETQSESDSDPKDGPQAKEKSEPKPSAADPVKSAAKKRRAAEPEITKKPKIKRVWSEKDEIVILEGMADYWGKFEADPTADYDAFVGFIKKSLDKKDPAKRQLQDKISKLKKKFRNNERREGKDGKEITFSQHEKALYELSKRVWGDKTADKGEEASQEDDKAETEPAKDDKVVAAVEKETVGAEKKENGEADDREKQLKVLWLEELQLNMRLWEVQTAQARLRIEQIKSEGK